MLRHLISIILLLFFGACTSAEKTLDAINDSVLPTEIQGEQRDRYQVKTSFELAAESDKQEVKKETVKKFVKKQKIKKGQKFTYPNRRPKKDPIWVGEKLTYEVTYFGVPAGTFTMEVLPHKEISGRKVYHVKGTAISSNLFSVFYELNDAVETFFDYEGFFSHRFHLVLDETKQTRNSLEIYDSENKKMFFWNRWNHHKNGYSEKKDFYPMPRFPQDSLSLLHYFRTRKLVIGEKISAPFVSEGKSWKVDIHVDRRERMRTPLGRIETLVLRPKMYYKGILKQKGDSFLWLSDDDRRFLVRMEAKVRVGTVVATLKDFEPGIPPESEKK